MALWAMEVIHNWGDSLVGSLTCDGPSYLVWPTSTCILAASSHMFAHISGMTIQVHLPCKMWGDRIDPCMCKDGNGVSQVDCFHHDSQSSPLWLDKWGTRGRADLRNIAGRFHQNWGHLWHLVILLRVSTQMCLKDKPMPMPTTMPGDGWHIALIQIQS